jgi:hypothetical protein
VNGSGGKERTGGPLAFPAGRRATRGGGGLRGVLGGRVAWGRAASGRERGPDTEARYGARGRGAGTLDRGRRHVGLNLFRTGPVRARFSQKI